MISTSLLEDEQGMGASASQTGLSQAEPVVSALTGFDPSRWLDQLMADADWRDALRLLYRRGENAGLKFKSGQSPNAMRELEAIMECQAYIRAAASAIEARSAETTGSARKGESAVPKGDAR